MRWWRRRSTVAPLVVGAVLLVAGRWPAGLVAVGVAVGQVVLGLVAPRAAEELGRSLARLGTAVLHGVQTVFWSLPALLVLGAWTVGQLVRRDPLQRGGGVDWVIVGSQPEQAIGRAAGSIAALGSPGRHGGDGHGGRRPVPRVLAWIGLAVVAIVANYLVGWGWDEAVGRGGPGSAAEAVAPGSSVRIVHDARTDLPSMAAYPWRERYFADLQRGTGGYWPFTEFRPDDFSSPYINVHEWNRKTYRPKGAADAMPVAWMFGGSTTWGEGQRDEYTIASQLARISEREGVPLVVKNFGQRGWTHFQEMVLFEQRLALEPVPDLALFYDGLNEINTQSLMSQAVPSHYQAQAYAERLTGRRIVTQVATGPSDGEAWEDAYWAYTRHSAIHKIARLFVPSAGASTSGRSRRPGGGFAPPVPERAPGQQATFNVTEQDGRDAGQVYERIKRLTLEVARRDDLPTFLFWQPEAIRGEAQRAALAQITAPTVDVTDALDGHGDVFIDGGHTNEEGARIVAERLWTTIGPAVHAWYDTHRAVVPSDVVDAGSG